MIGTVSLSDSIAEMTAAQAVELLCSRKMTAVQYAQAMLQRAEQYACINAFAVLDAEKVKTDSMRVHYANASGNIEPVLGGYPSCDAL
jgi:mandelamide amidase